MVFGFEGSAFFLCMWKKMAFYVGRSVCGIEDRIVEISAMAALSDS